MGQMDEDDASLTLYHSFSDFTFLMTLNLSLSTGFEKKEKSSLRPLKTMSSQLHCLSVMCLLSLNAGFDSVKTNPPPKRGSPSR